MKKHWKVPETFGVITVDCLAPREFHNWLSQDIHKLLFTIRPPSITIISIDYY